MKDSDIPRMSGLRDPPVEDQDVLLFEKTGATIKPKYSFDFPKKEKFSKRFILVGSVFDMSHEGETLVEKAKKYYKSLGYAVRTQKRTGRWGWYWNIYVGDGKWHKRMW